MGKKVKLYEKYPNVNMNEVLLSLEEFITKETAKLTQAQLDEGQRVMLDPTSRRTRFVNVSVRKPCFSKLAETTILYYISCAFVDLRTGNIYLSQNSMFSFGRKRMKKIEGNILLNTSSDDTNKLFARARETKYTALINISD